MSNSNLLNILKNKALKKKNAVLKITTSAIPTVQDPTLQTWIKSIDTSLRQLSKTSVSKTELDSAIASSGSGSSIGSDPNAELPDGEIDLTVPSAVTNLQASGAYSSVTLDWDTPKNSNFGRNVVYRSEVDDFGTAVEIGSTVGDVYTDYTGNGGKYYYWVRTISKYNVEGILSTSVYAETSLNVQYLLDQLTEKINLNQFTQALKSNIDLIPSIGSKIDDFFSQYAGSTDDYAGTNDIFSGHISEESIRIEADEAMAEKIDVLAVKVDEDITAAIQEESRVRTAADESLAEQVTTLQAQVGNELQQNIATIQTKLNTLTTADSALSERIDTTQSSTTTAQNTANAAQQAASAAATAAGNKGEVIFGSTAPSADKRLAQNLWIDTTGGANTPKRWSGTAWVAVTDKAATDAAAAANAAQTTANDALAKANTATTNLATVQTTVNTLTTQQSATASTVSTIQTTVNGHTSSIQQQSTAINGLTAEWKIKVQAGGKVSGVSLGTTGTESQFLVLADRFAIGQTTGTTTTYPFIVDSGKVIMNVAVIKDGSIEAAKIGNLSADKITTGSIAADRMKANIVQAVEGQFNSLSAITGTIGTLRTATSGARTEIRDNLIEVFDEQGRTRIKIGVFDV